MFRQYKLKNYHFQLVIYMAALTIIGILIIGSAKQSVQGKQILGFIMGLIITNLTMAIPGAIFQEAFLSYIGLGIKPPNCSWGVLAKDGIAQLRIHPYQVFVPAFLICTTMLALNLLGDGLRDALDPTMKEM